MHSQWQDNTEPPPTQYTIAFDSHDGSTVTAITANTGTPVNKPTDPTRDGYSFSGWFSAASSGTLYTWPHTLAGNITMHAQWTANTYTVTFRMNDGTQAVHGTKTVTVPAATVDGLPANPARNGYAFAEWNTEQNGTGTSFTAASAVSANLTVYAQWTANTYTVTFRLNDGTEAVHGTKTVTVPSATVDGLPANPSRNGYVFAEWNTEQNGTGTPFTAASAVSASLTIYAQWTANTYTVTFRLNDGTEAVHGTKTVTVPSATVDGLLANPSRNGYVFAEWNTQPNGTGPPFIASTTVNANITVYAQWTANT
jgi:uncharacterized repeat protein (TIGR02543 family)